MNMHSYSIQVGPVTLRVGCRTGGGDVGGASGVVGAGFSALQQDPRSTRGGRALSSCVLTPSRSTTWIPVSGREGGRFSPDCVKRVESSP